MSESVVCLGCGSVLGEQDESGGCQCALSPVQVQALVCPSCGGSLSAQARACPYCHSTVATRRCPSCSGWNLTGAKHCQSCGRPLIEAEAKAQAPAEVHCPRCSHRLTERLYAQLQVAECDGCGGLFIEPAMMERIVAERDAPTGLRLALPQRSYQRETQVQYIRCPVCTNTMNRQVFGRFSGVIVDVCRQHGVWFDPGELAEVVAFVQNGGLDRARARQLEELREAQRAARAEQMRASIAREANQSASLEEYGLFAPRHTLGLEMLRALIDLWK